MLTPQDFSVDLLTSILFCVAIYRGIIALYLNHLTLREKIFIFLFTLVSGIYVYQAIYQYIAKDFAPTIIWDILNGIMAFLSITAVTLLAQRSKKNEIINSNS